MQSDLRQLREHPFALFAALDTELRRVRFEADSSQFWTGLGFTLGDAHFVAPRDDIREVLPLPPTTPVPGAGKWLLGVANVRGELLSICDLRQLAGAEAAPTGRDARVLVYSAPRAALGLLVDSVLGHRQFVPGDQKHALADDTPAPLGDWLLGGFVRDGVAWRILSLHRLAASDQLLHAVA